MRYLVSNFESFLGFRLSGVFPPFVGHFLKRVRERKVKLRHIVYKVWLVSYLFFSFQIWYFKKGIITSIEQSNRWELHVSTPYEFLRVFNKLTIWTWFYLRCCLWSWLSKSFNSIGHRERRPDYDEMGIRHLHCSRGNLSASRTQLSAASEHARNNTVHYPVWEDKFIDRDPLWYSKVELRFLNRRCHTIRQHNNRSISLRIAERTVSSSNYANSSSYRSPTTLHLKFSTD